MGFNDGFKQKGGKSVDALISLIESESSQGKNCIFFSSFSFEILFKKTSKETLFLKKKERKEKCEKQTTLKKIQKEKRINDSKINKNNKRAGNK